MKPIKRKYKGFDILAEFYAQPDYWLLTVSKGENEYTLIPRCRDWRQALMVAYDKIDKTIQDLEAKNEEWSKQNE